MSALLPYVNGALRCPRAGKLRNGLRKLHEMVRQTATLDACTLCGYRVRKPA